jgi:hypothetical protein
MNATNRERGRRSFENTIARAREQQSLSPDTDIDLPYYVTRYVTYLRTEAQFSTAISLLEILIQDPVFHRFGGEKRIKSADMQMKVCRAGRCERSIGTVFQLPSPDATYSQDEGKERRWSPSPVVCVRAQSMCC